MGTKILTFSIHCLENESKKIHDSWERLNQLVRLVAGRSKLEKQQIRENYKAMYGELRNEISFPKDASPNGIKRMCSFMTHMNVILLSQGKLLDKLMLTKGLLLRFLSVENEVILCSSNRLIMKDLEGIWTKILPILSHPIHTKR